MRKVILLFLLFLSVAGVRTQGQNITFSHLTTDDGLSQFSVNSLYIDERGIIWIGTREGLNRYNGNDIKSFKLNKNDPNSLFSNTVLYGVPSSFVVLTSSPAGEISRTSDVAKRGIR